MNAEIIRFIARPSRDREPTDFPTIAFRSVRPETSVVEDADTAPCEYVRPENGES